MADVTLCPSVLCAASLFKRSRSAVCYFREWKNYTSVLLLSSFGAKLEYRTSLLSNEKIFLALETCVRFSVSFLADLHKLVVMSHSYTRMLGVHSSTPCR